MRRAIYAVFLLSLLVVSLKMNASQQDPAEEDPGGAAAQRHPRVVEPPPAPAPTPEQRKAMNKERYAKLKSDTDQLLKLANELKEAVDKANQDTLSLEVIKKTEQIEKLAKSVREKMKSY